MKPSIVLVDDDPIIRMDIREMLEEHGYSVVGEAKNGQEAIELVMKWKPDLVIMDVKMPLMNGIKAAQIIRKLQDPAVLLLTAYSQKEWVQQARETGVTAYLVKPVGEESLLPAVEIALGQREQVQLLKEAYSQLMQSFEDRKTVEKAKRMIMREYALEEEEAYRRMRKASMEQRIPLNKLAEYILEGRSQLYGMVGNG